MYTSEIILHLGVIQKQAAGPNTISAGHLFTFKIN